MIGKLWRELEPGPEPPEIVYAIIEIPKGSRNKYEFDKKKGYFVLDRVLYTPFHYPTDYGIIPKTFCDDGDPLDIMVIMEQPTFPGCVIEVRPVALLKMIDSGDYDDKVLAVPTKDPRFENIKDMGDIPEHTFKEISHFFEHYKELEGKEVKILGWKDADHAKRVIESSIEYYKRKFEE